MFLPLDKPKIRHLRQEVRAEKAHYQIQFLWPQFILWRRRNCHENERTPSLFRGHGGKIGSFAVSPPSVILGANVCLYVEERTYVCLSVSL